MSSRTPDRGSPRPMTLARMAAALLMLASAPALAGFAGTDLFLPMAGRQAGVHPSNWYTKVWIHNPAAEAATARIYFLKRGSADPTPPFVDVPVAGGDTEAIDNIIETLFHLQAFGALRVTCTTQTLIVTSRVYSRGEGLADRDSVGQDFAGVPASFAIGVGEAAQVLGVYQTLPAVDSVFRFNYGFVETTGHSATVRVTVTSGDNQPLGSEDLNVLAWSQRQVTFADHFPGVSTENARLTFEVVAGSGKVIGYGSGIANGSQDPTTFEMSYRNELLAGSAANGVPSGAVMMFDLAACPTGWTELVAARGRALVGLTEGGTGAGTVGAPLADLEDRQHTHSVDPATTGTTLAGDHAHGLSALALSSETAGGHGHQVDIENTTSSLAGGHGHTVPANEFEMQYAGGYHNHRWAMFRGANKDWRTYDGSGQWTTIVDHGDGLNLEGENTYPLALVQPFDNEDYHYYTDNWGIHTHAITVPQAATLAAASHTHTTNPGVVTSSTAGSHTHPVNLPAGTTSTAGSHGHALDLPAALSTAAATSGVMPYVQLRVCRKD